MTLRPAAAGSGIRFVRTDLPGGVEIPAAWDSVVDTRLCTVLGAQGATVGTVEHLMAALVAYGVDNAVIDIDGPEIPIMDGSASAFAFMLDCAGVVAQGRPRRVLRVLKEVSVAEGGKRATLSPAEGRVFALGIEFPSAAIGHQRREFDLDRGAFRTEIAWARTFGFLHEVEALRAAGLARGGSLDNAIVIDGDRVLNEGGLRYRDEFVRHKLLDSIGDLGLAGGAIIGRFEGVRTGHALNNLVLRRLFADRDAWCWEEKVPEDVRLAA